MKLPKFELTRIHSDGSQESPEVFPIEDLPFEKVTAGRRGFLGAGLTAAALLASGNLKAAAAKTASGKLLAHDTAIRSLRFSKDGKTLISVAADDVKIWGMPSGKLLRKIEDISMDGIEPVPGNKFFAAMEYNQIEIRSICE